MITARVEMATAMAMSLLRLTKGLPVNVFYLDAC